MRVRPFRAASPTDRHRTLDESKSNVSLSLSLAFSDEMFLDELQEASSVDLGPNRGDAIGIRAGQLRFRHVGTLLFHSVIRQNIDDAKSVQFTAIGR